VLREQVILPLPVPNRVPVPLPELRPGAVDLLDGAQLCNRHLIGACTHEIAMAGVQADHGAMHVSVAAVLEKPETRELGGEGAGDRGKGGKENYIH